MKAQVMEQNIVVVTFSRRGKNRAIPLVTRVLGENGNRVVVVGRDSYAPKGFPRGAVLRSFDNYLDEETYQRAKDSALNLFEALALNGSFKEALTYDAIPLWDTVQRPIFWRFLELMKYIRAAENIMDREQPKEVVVVSDSDSSLFWLNIESGLAERRILRFIVSWITRCRKTSLGEAVVCHVVKNRAVAVSEVKGGRFSSLGRRLVFPLLPSAFKYSVRCCDLYRRAGERFSRFRTAGSLSASNKNRICLICASRNEVVGAAPIIGELQKDESNDVLVIRAGGLLTNSTQKALEREGLSYRNYESYITGEVRNRVSKGARSLAEKWQKLKADQGFREALNYQGVPLWESLEDDLHQVFLALLPQAIGCVETVNHIIDVERPNIIMVMNETLMLGAVVALVSESRGLPTVDVEFGAGIGEKIDVPIPTSISEAVDKVVVWGEAMRASAIAGRKISPDRVVVAGSPSFDDAVRRMKDFREEKFRREMALEAGKSTILFASQPVQSPVTAEIREQLVRCVYRAIRGLPDIQFVVKLHPGEGFDLHHELRREMGLGNVVITKDVNLYHLFGICDVVIVCTSTVGLEAMIMDRPVIDVNLAGMSDGLPYVERGAAIGVRREEELVPAIEAALHDEDVRSRLAEGRRQFVYDYAYLQDGQAARRVADLIMQMIEESRGAKGN